MIIARRRVVRLTTEIDQRTGRAWVIRINEGGRSVSVRLKGTRTWTTCTLRQVITMAAWNAAAAIKAEKKRRKLERQQQRKAQGL
jgi:hypothetical protein